MAARFHYLFSQCLVLVLAAVVASCSSSLTTNNNIDLYVRSLPSLSQRAPYDIFPKRSQLTQSSYNPLSDLCGIGRSCSQACGSSFQTCPSNDQILHCFNPSSGQECCANGSGYACESAFYCAQTPSTGRTLCCPNELSLSACAELNDTPTLETAHSTTTTTLFAPPTIAPSSVTFVQTETVVVMMSGSRSLVDGTVTVSGSRTVDVNAGLIATATATLGSGASGNASVNPNSTYVEYTSGMGRDELGRNMCWWWSVLGVLAGIVVGVGVF